MENYKIKVKSKSEWEKVRHLFNEIGVNKRMVYSEGCKPNENYFITKDDSIKKINSKKEFKKYPVRKITLHELELMVENKKLRGQSVYSLRNESKKPQKTVGLPKLISCISCGASTCKDNEKCWWCGESKTVKTTQGKPTPIEEAILKTEKELEKLTHETLWIQQLGRGYRNSTKDSTAVFTITFKEKSIEERLTDIEKKLGI